MGTFFFRRGTSEEAGLRTKDSGTSNIFSNILQQFGLNADLGNAFMSWLKSQTGEDLTNAQKAQNQFNAQQAQAQREWEEQMANTSFQRGVADLQKAGLNPALAYGGAQASTPQGSAAGGSSPSAAGIGDFISLILGLKEFGLKESQTAADVELKQAEAGKVRSETSYQDIINKYEEAIRNLDIELKRQNVGLTEAQIAEVNALREKIEKERDLIIEQITTELRKQDLIVSEEALNKALTALHRMQAKEIFTLLPLKESLLQSEVNVNEAQAEELYAKQMELTQEYWFKMKLYENEDYVQAVADLMISQANREGNEAAVAEMKKNREKILDTIRQGRLISTGNETIDKYCPFAINEVLRVALYAVEVAGPALLGGIAGGAVAGARKAKPVKGFGSSSSTSHMGFTSNYGID